MRCRWGTTGDFATCFLHFSLFSTALWDLPNSRPVHSLMLSSYLFLCLPCLLLPFTVPCNVVLARMDEPLLVILTVVTYSLYLRQLKVIRQWVKKQNRQWVAVQLLTAKFSTAEFFFARSHSYMPSMIETLIRRRAKAKHCREINQIGRHCGFATGSKVNQREVVIKSCYLLHSYANCHNWSGVDLLFVGQIFVAFFSPR